MSMCKNCDDGEPVLILDLDGVRSEISGHPGWPCHAYEDMFWLCGNVVQETKSSYSKAMAGSGKKLPVLCPKCKSDYIFCRVEDSNACDCADCGYKWNEIARRFKK